MVLQCCLLLRVQERDSAKQTLKQEHPSVFTRAWRDVVVMELQGAFLKFVQTGRVLCSRKFVPGEQLHLR